MSALFQMMELKNPWLLCAVWTAPTHLWLPKLLPFVLIFWNLTGCLNSKLSQYVFEPLETFCPNVFHVLTSTLTSLLSTVKKTYFKAHQPCEHFITACAVCYETSTRLIVLANAVCIGIDAKVLAALSVVWLLLPSVEKLICCKSWDRPIIASGYIYFMH